MTTFKGKINFLFLFLIIVNVISVSFVILGKKEISDEMSSIQKLSGLAVKISALVHETQKERGMTAGYLGSKGKKFTTELTGQRGNTDQKISDLKTFLSDFEGDAFGMEFRNKLGMALKRLDMVQGKRNSISSMSLSVTDAIWYYTKINTDFLDTIAVIERVNSNAEMSGILAAYTNFLKGKERAGIERAVLSNTFAADKFGPGMFKKFSTLVTAQDVYGDVFLSFATAGQRNFHSNTMRGRAVDEVENMRSVAFDKAAEGNFGIDSTYWFGVATKRINLLKSVEDKISKDIYEKADELKGEARFTLMISVLGGLAVVLAIVLGWVMVVNPLVRFLGNMVGEVLGNAEEFSSLSGQISSSSQSVSEGAAEQAANVEETSSSLEEISSTIQQNADNAGEAKELSLLTKETAEEGAYSVTKLVEAVDMINESSQEVSKIIKVIDEIAFQTNLLALNAAVEAARAGDHGKGFAVVADEVRSLAGRSAEAAKATEKLIEESTAKAKTGNTIAKESGEVLNKIVANASKASTLISEIALASKEQAEGIKQVTNALGQMDELAHGNSAFCEETAAASEELSAQAEGLKGLVENLSAMIGGVSSMEVRG